MEPDVSLLKEMEHEGDRLISHEAIPLLQSIQGCVEGGRLRIAARRVSCIWGMQERRWVDLSDISPTSFRSRQRIAAAYFLHLKRLFLLFLHCLLPFFFDGRS